MKKRCFTLCFLFSLVASLLTLGIFMLFKTSWSETDYYAVSCAVAAAIVFSSATSKSLFPKPFFFNISPASETIPEPIATSFILSSCFIPHEQCENSFLSSDKSNIFILLFYRVSPVFFQSDENAARYVRAVKFICGIRFVKRGERVGRRMPAEIITHGNNRVYGAY